MRLSTVAVLVWGIGAVMMPARHAGAGGASDFDERIAPILARRCLDCHSGPEPKGGLDLSRQVTAMRGGDSGAAIVPARPEESLLWEHVAEGTMPPKSALPEAEKAVLRGWIAAGAAWGRDPIDPYEFSSDRRAGRDWWSLRPVVRPALPAVKDAGWCANPVDRFVLRRLEHEGLSPAPPADRRTLIRRLSFDLLGLPPTPEEVDAFVADAAVGSYERLVDRYLTSNQYGVRWGRLWLDLARYGESNGFEHDEFRPDSWPYRDWVVRALNRDLPYDQFARLQLAGDVLRPADPEAVEATGFLVAGAFDSVGQGQQSEAMRKVVRQDELEDMVGTVGQAFLGLTVQCARCHDHKFDPIRQVEYYRMAAALAGVRHGVRDVAPLDPEVSQARRRIAERRVRVEAIEAVVRVGPESPSQTAPEPIAAWDFTAGERDQVGGLHASLRGDARLVRAGLRIDVGTGFADTEALPRDLTSKTLEVWVRLDGLKQPGGSVLGVRTLDRTQFDAIAFSEREPGRWWSASEGPARTRGFNGPAESRANPAPVHVAMVYAADGTITAYRDGKAYGVTARTAGPATFRAGRAQVVFGPHRGLPGTRRLLGAWIARARLYDRALTAREVAASAASVRVAPSGPEIENRLAPAEQTERRRLLAEIDALWNVVESRTRRVYAVCPEPPAPFHRLLRGDSAHPAELVAAGGLAAITGPAASFELAPAASDAARRVALAAWVTDPGNPLFTRVIANRLWQGHFGAGLVENPSDHGFQGGRPSHPELLDWLAGEVAARGFRLKEIHRLIVTSAAYRQSSRSNRSAATIDVAGRLFWRKAPMRLEAEAIRDAMLAVSGALNLRAEGPGFREFVVSNAPGTVSNRYTPIETQGVEFDRRTLYRAWARGARSGLLDAFDCPDPSTTAPRRAVTTTPLQALALLNNAQVLRLAERFAERLQREAGDDAGRQVERAYRLAFARTPDAAERARAVAVVERHGAAVLARAIFNSNEFLYVD